MGNTKRLPMRLQAVALLSVCAVRLAAPGLAAAQATNPPPAVPPAATRPAVPTPPAAAPMAPATGAPGETAPGTASATPEPGAVEQPALPTYPASATPPEQAVGPDGQPLSSSSPMTPAAAEPTSPPAYVEPMTPAAGEVNIQAAPTIDEQLVSEPRSKLPSYIMWGVGGASLITGAVLGITALAAKSDFNDNPTYEAANRTEGRAIAADVALGLGAVLLITGTAFYLMPDSQESRPATATNTRRPTARLHLTPMLGRTNGGALTLQF
jgi:hypothetical protein